MKISIIVPIYNAELYLNECIDSIISQSYNNIELILINDGSKDNSEKICLNYANKDKRIKYIYQKNAGVSAARNNGVKESSGEYILFVDSDDFLEKDALSQIIENIKNVDLLCFGYKAVYTDKSINNCLQSELCDLNTIKEKILLDNNIGGFLWNKLFLSKIIKNNELKFNQKIHFCEDLLFVTEYIKYCKKIKYINQCLYHYRMRKSSASGNYFNKKSTSILIAYESILKSQQNTKIIDELKYRYLLNYYKLKDYIDFKINENILNEERKIMRTRSQKERIKFLILKKFRKLYLFFKKRKSVDKELFL